MSALLPWLLARTPEVARRLALVELFKTTAAAFGKDMPRLSGLSREQCLLEYARFTAERAEESFEDPAGLQGLRERLYCNAYSLGRIPGWLLRRGNVDAVMAAARFLYSALDIDLKGNADGDITIHRCYFSRFYSPEVCRLMSAMDRGLLAGLSGGGVLVFAERITEGRPCCRARLTLEESR